MVPSFSPRPLPSTCSVYVPALVARLTPANPYRQWHALLGRNENSCPRKFPCNSVIWLGAVTRKIIGEPLTSLVGSHCALHFSLAAALTEKLVNSSRHRVENRRRKNNM